MSRSFDPAEAGYIDVAARIVEFRNRYPEGSLQPVDPANPYRIETIGDRTFIVYTAAAYRHPDDKRPGIGVAWEPFPGLTPYTRNSELMNAETSAWGRAIIAVLAADAKRGIASLEEVRNRQAEREQQPRNGNGNGWPQTARSPVTHPMLSRLGQQFAALGVEDPATGLEAIRLLIGAQVSNTRELTREQAAHLIEVLDRFLKQPQPAAAFAAALAEARGRVAGGEAA